MKNSKKIENAFMIVNNHIEEKQKELNLLIEKINRYEWSMDVEKWLKIKRGDQLRLLKIGKNTLLLNYEDIVTVKDVSFYPEKEERKITVDVSCVKVSNNYRFKMRCIINTHKEIWNSDKRKFEYGKEKDPNCYRIWNFESVK